MPDETGSRLNERLNGEQLSEGMTRQNPADFGRVQPWNHADRIRLFLWAGIAFLPAAGIAFIAHLTGTRSDSLLSVQNELPVKVVTVFFVVLATWIISRIERRPLAAYGIPLRQAFQGKFWEGSVWGFVMLSAITMTLRTSGHFRIDAAAPFGMAVLWWGLAWGATFLAVSLSEELAFRGYWLFSMSRRMRFWPAALFLSAVFGVAHLTNHGETALGIVQVFATGLLFCLMIRRTGNLWFAIGFHAAWDWAETFFYGTPDSGMIGVGHFLTSTVQGPNWLTGGSVGPEGSVFALVVLAACALLILIRFPKAVYPDRPA